MQFQNIFLNYIHNPFVLMKLIYYFINMTPLYLAIKKKNVFLVQILLKNEKIDVNIINKILISLKLYSFKSCS